MNHRNAPYPPGTREPVELRVPSEMCGEGQFFNDRDIVTFGTDGDPAKGILADNGVEFLIPSNARFRVKAV